MQSSPISRATPRIRSIDVDNYWLCQKVRAAKRRERNTYWVATAAQIQAERPEKNKAEVRVALHARILSLVDQFTADVQGLSDEERARVINAMKNDQVRLGPRLRSPLIL